MQSKARITAIGAYVPEKRLTNEDIERLVDTNNEWILQRTGMKERRVSGKEEFASTLAFKAIENLIETYNKELNDVDCIVVSTTTPDYAFPSVACQIQDYFKIPHTGALDFNTTCAGFTYGLHLANSLITSELHQKVLVVTTETLTKVTDYTDRATCILFGDGAAAVLVERDEENPSFLASYMGTNGDGGMHVYRTNLSSTMNGIPLKADGKIVQNGREVYKWVSRTLPSAIDQLLEKGNFQLNEIDWFVPHSANIRMIESVCERSGISMDKTLTSAEYMGNTSSVTIPLSLHLGIQNGKVKNGDILMIYGFGGGLTHAGHIIRWNLDTTKEA